MFRAAIALICMCALCLSLSSCGRTDHMAQAKEQLVDISKTYLAKDHPDWAGQCQCDEIIVIERASCWEVHFPLQADSANRTVVVRLAKGTLEPVGMFHE